MYKYFVKSELNRILHTYAGIASLDGFVFDSYTAALSLRAILEAESSVRAN